MHIILTGATGLVGSATLVALMGMKDIAKISILSRRPVPMVEAIKDDRVEVIIHKDFTKYEPALLERLRGANGCVWALGVSQNDVPKEEYVHITKTLTIEAAQAFQQLKPDNDKFNFVFVSGDGATREPTRWTPLFGRVKGEAETTLMNMNQANPHFRPIIARPAFVDSKGHDEIQQWIPPSTCLKRFTETMLGPVVRSAMPAYHSPTNPLGEFLAKCATGSLDKELKGDGIEVIGGTATVANVGIRRLMNL